jgi:hypothetical protein
MKTKYKKMNTPFGLIQMFFRYVYFEGIYELHILLLNTIFYDTGSENILLCNSYHF